MLSIVKQTLPAVNIPLLFYCGLASAELTYLCFVFLRFWLLGPARRECGYLAKPEVHNASYRQPKQTDLRTAERQAAYNLHYVNIALGTVFPGMSFCISAGAALAGFVLPLKIWHYKNKSRHPAEAGQVVLQKGGTKSMTGKRAGRDGRGEG